MILRETENLKTAFLPYVLTQAQAMQERERVPACCLSNCCRKLFLNLTCGHHGYEILSQEVFLITISLSTGLDIKLLTKF